MRVHEEIGARTVKHCLSCGSEDVVYSGHIDKKMPEASRVMNRAVDETARITMEDYKMGDLKDHVHVGESMAPKLAPEMQARADNFFGGGGGKRRGTLPVNAGNIARQAMAGRYRTPGSYVDPVKSLQPSYKPRVNIVAGEGVRK
jgi:hypothetical protein